MGQCSSFCGDFCICNDDKDELFESRAHRGYVSPKEQISKATEMKREGSNGHFHINDNIELGQFDKTENSNGYLHNNENGHT